MLNLGNAERIKKNIKKQKKVFDFNNKRQPLSTLFSFSYPLSSSYICHWTPFRWVFTKGTISKLSYLGSPKTVFTRPVVLKCVETEKDKGMRQWVCAASFMW